MRGIKSKFNMRCTFLYELKYVGEWGVGVGSSLELIWSMLLGNEDANAGRQADLFHRASREVYHHCLPGGPCLERGEYPKAGQRVRLGRVTLPKPKLSNGAHKLPVFIF